MGYQGILRPQWTHRRSAEGHEMGGGAEDPIGGVEDRAHRL